MKGAGDNISKGKNDIEGAWPKILRLGCIGTHIALGDDGVEHGWVELDAQAGMVPCVQHVALPNPAESAAPLVSCLVMQFMQARRMK